MKLLTWTIAVTLACGSGMVLAQAQKQEPPAGRVGLAPADKTKVSTVLSRSLIHDVKGARDHAQQTQRDVVSNTNAGGKGCVTNIGTPAPAENQRQIGSRYGTSHNDQVVAVRGSIISVCK